MNQVALKKLDELCFRSNLGKRRIWIFDVTRLPFLVEINCPVGFLSNFRVSSFLFLSLRAKIWYLKSLLKRILSWNTMNWEFNCKELLSRWFIVEQRGVFTIKIIRKVLTEEKWESLDQILSIRNDLYCFGIVLEIIDSHYRLRAKSLLILLEMERHALQYPRQLKRS